MQCLNGTPVNVSGPVLSALVCFRKPKVVARESASRRRRHDDLRRGLAERYQGGGRQRVDAGRRRVSRGPSQHEDRDGRQFS